VSFYGAVAGYDASLSGSTHVFPVYKSFPEREIKLREDEYSNASHPCDLAAYINYYIIEHGPLEAIVIIERYF